CSERNAMRPPSRVALATHSTRTALGPTVGLLPDVPQALACGNVGHHCQQPEYEGQHPAKAQPGDDNADGQRNDPFWPLEPADVAAQAEAFGTRLHIAYH